MPLPKDSPFDIRLSSGRESKPYGLILERGSLSVSAVAQDDTVYIRNVGKKTGDFDEQRSWKGGRGHEKFNDNAEGYWDGTAWTMTKGHVHNALLWRYAKGLRKATSNFSNSKSWRALVGASLGISVSFTPDETGAYDAATFFVRWRGSSVATNALTIKLHSNSSGDPGTVLQTVTKAVSDVNGDELSALLLCDWTGTETLTAGTTYHFTISGASTSSTASHWEVAVDATGTSSKISSDLSTWSTPSPTFSLLYRVTDAAVPRSYYPFFLDNHFYVVDYKTDATTASQLYINGDRGKATAGASATLTDTNNGVRSTAWTTNMWAGAWIRIVRGTGKGQKREIASNTGTVITVGTTWNTTPDTTSEYVIYSTSVFQELTTTGLGVVTGEPAVLGNIVYFPQGTTAIREMALDYTVATNHKYRSEATNTADFLFSSYDRADGAILWRALNTTVSVSFAKVVTYGSDLSFGTAITCGDTSYPITGLNEKEGGGLLVFKENGPGQVSSNAYTALKTGQEDTPDDSNGRASIAVDRFTYYSWLHSLIRVYGSSHDDIGQDFSGIGLPAGREGSFYYLDAYITTLLCAVSAPGSGRSSVQAWDGLAWHEVFRHPLVANRVRMVKVQPCPDTRNMVWISVGAGDLVYIEMPLQKKDPILDTGALYMHESILESSIIDMGAASDLPKMVKSLTATVRNLNSEGMEAFLDYKINENCLNSSSPWIKATTLTQSPESTAYLGLQNIRRFQYRLRMNTDNALVPVDIEGIVPSGYARTPLKLMWTMRIKAGGVYQVGSQTNHNSSKLWRWLMDNARFPYSVYMESKYDAADGYHVIVHPPRMTPYKPAEPGQPEESYMTLTLEEI